MKEINLLSTPVWTMYTPGEEVCFMPPSVAASTSASGQCVPKSAPTAAPVQSGYVGNQAVLPPQGNLVASLASKSVPTSQTTIMWQNKIVDHISIHIYISLHPINYTSMIYSYEYWIHTLSRFVSACVFAQRSVCQKIQSFWKLMGRWVQ